jgi:hypothetical protein
MSEDARPQPLTLLTPAASGAEVAACEGDACIVPATSTTQE